MNPLLLFSFETANSKTVKTADATRQNQMLVLTGDVVDVPFLYKAVTEFSKAINKRKSKRLK